MKLLTILADGSEELEAIAVIDIMRRCGIEVTVAGLSGVRVRAAHGTEIICDTVLEECETNSFDAIFLPGGLNGSLSFHDSGAVQTLLREMADAGKIISAICAAPIALARAGLLENKVFTMYPGFEEYLGGKIPTGNLAETDGKIVTGKGPGAVFAFSQQLASTLKAEKEFAAVSAGMFLPL